MSATSTSTPGPVEVTVNIYDASGNWVAQLSPAQLGAAVTALSLSPSIFSPNGDGVDDTVTIRGIGTAGAVWVWNGVNAQGQVLEPGVYRLVVESVLEDGSRRTVTVQVIIRAASPSLIASLDVGPNPASSRLWIRGQGKGSGRFQVRIYDVSAELVWRAEAIGGVIDEAWNLTTRNGGKAAAGVYILVVDYEALGLSERKIVPLGVIR